MHPEYWQKQEDKPLFEDILWSKPENPRLKGKLLIVGGHSGGFSSLAQSYQTAKASGAGKIYIALPSKLKSVLGPLLENTEYLNSTSLGSIAKNNLNQLLGLTQSADCVLVCGELSNNSETVNLFEDLIPKIGTPLVLTGDSVAAIKNSADKVLSKDNLILVAHFGDLQRLISLSTQPDALKSDMGVLEMVNTLHDISLSVKACLVTRVLQDVFIAYGGEVITQHLDTPSPHWAVELAAKISTYQAQNLGTALKISASALFELSEAK